MQQISLKIRNFQWICDAHAFSYCSIICLILRGDSALSSKTMCNSPFNTKLLWDFCSSVQEFASQHFLLTSGSLQILFLPPRLAPLPSANASYCQTCSGLSSPSCCQCRAHLNNNTPKYLFQLWGVVCVLLDTHRMQRRKMNS